MPLSTFTNNMKTLYKAPLRNTEFVDQADAKRENEYSTALQLYQGRHNAILEGDIYDIFSGKTAAQLVKNKTTFNIIKRIIDKLGMVYKVQPSLSCDSNPDLVDVLDDVTGAMKQADRISELCGLCWVQPVWDAQRKKVVATVIPPDRVRGTWNDYDPSRLEQVELISYIFENSKQVTISTVWTNEFFAIYKGKKDITDEVLEHLGLPPNPDRVNPFGVIPLIPMYSRIPLLGDHFGEFKEDLVTAQRTINVRLTDLQTLIQYQSFGQLVIAGIDPADARNIQVGPNIPIILGLEGDKTPSASFINPNAAIGEVWKTIQELIRYLAFTYCLGNNWAESGTMPSGEALKVVNADLAEYREDKCDSHKQFWFAFAKVSALVSQIEGQVGNGSSEDFDIEFAEMDVYTDPNEEIKEWEELIKNGIRSRVDWYLDENPENDEATALSNLKANLSLESDLVKNTRTPAATANDFKMPMDMGKAGTGSNASPMGNGEAVPKTMPMKTDNGNQ